MSYIFYSPLEKPWVETEEMVNWAKKCCPSYITNDAKMIEGVWFYCLYFGQEKDYVSFSLRYG